MLRYGCVPLGGNPHAEPSLNEIILKGDQLNMELLQRLHEDDVLSLDDSYGDPLAGDPVLFDALRITLTDNSIKEIEVFNMAILLLLDNWDETRRLFRVINTIKSEQCDAPNGYPRHASC